MSGADHRGGSDLASITTYKARPGPGTRVRQSDAGLEDLRDAERNNLPGHGQLAEPERLIHLAVQHLDGNPFAGLATTEIDDSLHPVRRTGHRIARSLII
jgi:hypothetical protein